jgi:hypothetical protein
VRIPNAPASTIALATFGLRMIGLRMIAFLTADAADVRRVSGAGESLAVAR